MTNSGFSTTEPRRFTRNAPEQQVNEMSCTSGKILLHGRKCWHRLVRKRQVIIADHMHLTRHLNAMFGERA